MSVIKNMLTSGLCIQSKGGFGNYKSVRDENPRNDVVKPFVQKDVLSTLPKSNFEKPLEQEFNTSQIFYNGIFGKSLSADERNYLQGEYLKSGKKTTKRKYKLNPNVTFIQEEPAQEKQIFNAIFTDSLGGEIVPTKITPDYSLPSVQQLGIRFNQDKLRIDTTEQVLNLPDTLMRSSTPQSLRMGSLSPDSVRMGSLSPDSVQMSPANVISNGTILEQKLLELKNTLANPLKIRTTDLPPHDNTEGYNRGSTPKTPHKLMGVIPAVNEYQIALTEKVNQIGKANVRKQSISEPEPVKTKMRKEPDSSETLIVGNKKRKLTKPKKLDENGRMLMELKRRLAILEKRKNNKAGKMSNRRKNDLLNAIYNTERKIKDLEKK